MTNCLAVLHCGSKKKFKISFNKMIKDPVEVFRLIGINLGLSQIVILVIIICLPEILSPIATGHDILYFLSKNVSGIALPLHSCRARFQKWPHVNSIKHF